MGATEVLSEIIKSKTGNLVECEYSSNGVLNKTNTIPFAEVDVGYKLNKAMYSTTLYKLLGLRKIFSEMGVGDIADVDNALKNIDPIGKTIYDTVSRQTLSINDYVQRYANARNWSSFLSGANVHKNEDLGKAQVVPLASGRGVGVTVSDLTERDCKIIAAVLAQNNISFTFETGTTMDLDDASAFVEALPSQLSNAIALFKPKWGGTITWTLPGGLANIISTNGYRYCTVTLVDMHYSWPGPQLLPSESWDNTFAWCPLFILSQYPIVGDVVVTEKYHTLGALGDCLITANFENSGDIALFSMYPLSFYRDYTSYTSVAGNYTYVENTASLENFGFRLESTLAMGGSCGAPSGNENIFSNNEGSSFDTSVWGEDTPVDFTTTLKNKLTATFTEAGYGVGSGNTLSWALPRYTDASFTNTFAEEYDLKYLNVMALLSNSPSNACLPIVILSSAPIRNLAASTNSVGAYTDPTCTVTFEADSGTKIAILRDSSYFRSSSAWVINGNSKEAQSYEWNGYSTIVTMNGTSYSGSWKVNALAGSLWNAGTMVSRTAIQILQNSEISGGDSPYPRMYDALYNGTLSLAGRTILFSDDTVEDLLEGADSITDVSDLVNVIPTDGTVSIIDGTTTIDDALDIIQANNIVNGVVTPTITPSRELTDYNINFFTKLYKIDASELSELARFIYNTDWTAKVIRTMSGNPMDGIISIMGYPFEPDAESGNTVLNICGTTAQWDPGTGLISVYGKKLNSFKQKVNMGSISLNQLSSVITNTFMDYSPYTSAYIYLPFFGLVDLDFDTILSFISQGGNPRLTLEYNVEFVTGSASIALRLKNDNGSDTVVLQTSAMLGLSIPTTSGTFPTIQNAIIGSVTGALKGAMLGGAGAVTGAIANFQGNDERKTMGGIAGNTGFASTLDPYIVIKTHAVGEYYNSDTFKRTNGYVSHSEAKLVNIKDEYLELEGLELTSTGATEREQEMLKEILEGGFWTD